MNISGTQAFPASPSEVWAVTFDPEVLVQSIPGAEVVEQTSASTFEGEIVRGLASITVTMDLIVEVVDDDRPDQVTCEIEGTDNRINSTVQGLAVISVDEDGERSMLSYDVDLNFTGRLVSLGSRMIKRQMNKDLEVFFQNLEGVLDKQASAEPT